jgi:hypothetical protein
LIRQPAAIGFVHESAGGQTRKVQGKALLDRGAAFTPIVFRDPVNAPGVIRTLDDDGRIRKQQDVALLQAQRGAVGGKRAAFRRQAFSGRAQIGIAMVAELRVLRQAAAHAAQNAHGRMLVSFVDGICATFLPISVSHEPPGTQIHFARV